ncbi:helix-turn-helix domain-containing protein [Anaerosinus sp.]|uniref:helix-turn-helix domain-containing protein n=1 Tax=Selenobaculum sp. TaxID=3074374 RepID=UPI003AB7E547
MQIKLNLSRIMGEKRIKITELATLAGISKTTVMALYHEKAKGVTFDVLAKLCAALNCQPADIMEYVPDKAE